jgi:hypothetical protein
VVAVGGLGVGAVGVHRVVSVSGEEFILPSGRVVGLRRRTQRTISRDDVVGGPATGKRGEGNFTVAEYVEPRTAVAPQLCDKALSGGWCHFGARCRRRRCWW